MGKVKEIVVADDIDWTLSDWKIFIDSLIKDYGEDTVMYTDAGYNNVSLIVLIDK